MFQCKLHEAIVLKKIVEAIKDVVNSVNINASPQGLSFQAMDLSHVALVTLHLRSEGFATYKADKSFPLGVKLQNLHKILKCADSSDMITMECEDEPQVLQFKFESQKQDKISKFTLNLMQNDEDQLAIPETNYSSNITLPASEFARIVRELSQLSETVKIRTSRKSITFAVDGDIGKGEMELKENNSEKTTEKIEIDVDEEVEASFSLTFLNSFCKGGALSDSVRLLMSENTPLVVEYKIGDIGTLKYYLAPKLQDE